MAKSDDSTIFARVSVGVVGTRTYQSAQTVTVVDPRLGEDFPAGQSVQFHAPTLAPYRPTGQMFATTDKLALLQAYPVWTETNEKQAAEASESAERQHTEYRVQPGRPRDSGTVAAMAPAIVAIIIRLLCPRGTDMAGRLLNTAIRERRSPRRGKAWFVAGELVAAQVHRRESRQGGKCVRDRTHKRVVREV